MKLTIIGGGGIRTPLLTTGLLRRLGEVPVRELWLMDVNRGKLDAIGALCAELIRQSGQPLALRLTVSAEEALRGADIVILTVRVGYEEGRILDERIALRHGFAGQETTAPAGFAMAVRTVPVMLEYYQKIERLCPGAELYNFSNPAGLVTQALVAVGAANVVGICDSPSHLRLRLALGMGVPHEQLTLYMYGLNHLSWASRVTLNGGDILPRLLEDSSLRERIPELKLFDPDLLELLGCIPNEYLFFYYHREIARENMARAPQSRGEQVLTATQDLLAQLRQVDAAKNPQQALALYRSYIFDRKQSYMKMEAGKENRPELIHQEKEGEGYAGVALDTMLARRKESPRRMVLNVLNGSTLPELAPKDVIEATCEVSAAGIKPVQPAILPESARVLIRAVKLYEQLTIEAIQARSRKKAIEALMVHPLINSYSAAATLVQDYFEAHRTYLTGWS